MKKLRNDNKVGESRLHFRAFSFLLIALLPTAFSMTVFYACVTEQDRTSVIAEGESLPVRDPNYYYLPDYEAYYYPPNHQWIYFDGKANEWLVSHVRPENMKHANLSKVKLVRLDYEGFTPYQFHEKNKLKYPGRNKSTHPHFKDTVKFK